jgi:uncharacterized protein (TIGR03083 family)
VAEDEVVVQLRGWRRILATKAELRFPLASVVRVEHDPLARLHVRAGLRKRRHGQGLWRLGLYHGLDGWSFWSIGLGRNAVLLECSAQRFRYVVVEVADPARTVRDVRAAVAHVTGEIPGGLEAGPPEPGAVQPKSRAAPGEPRAANIEVMKSHRLDYESHRAALERECDLILDASAEENLELPVPTCPEWRLSELIGHLGDVYSFWQCQLGAASPEAPAEPPARAELTGRELTEWFERSCESLRAALASHDPEDPCWNWSGAELTAAWVARRMALESAVHRYDAELCLDAATAIDRDLAVDGIDEWISVHLATDVPEAPEATLGGVLCLSCADASAAWTVEIAGGRLRWREGSGPADAVLVGSASDLYLYCWNRRPLDVLALTGSREVALAWTSLPI